MLTNTEMEQAHGILIRSSKEELVRLIEQMLRRAPEMATLLPPAVPPSAGGGQDLESYWKQAAAAFRNLSHDWGVEERVAEALDPLFEKGDAFLEQGEVGNAAAVYQAISAQVTANVTYYRDESGTLSGVVLRCAEGLGHCLSALPMDQALRARILLALFNIYQFDMQMGGVGMSDPVVNLILDYALGTEVEQVANWLLAALARTSGTDWSAQYQRQAYNEFLLRLHQNRMDDEVFLRFCRESHRTRDLVERLLQLSRLDEVRAAVESAPEAELVPLAEALLAYGQTDLAETALGPRAENSYDPSLLQWLKDHYKETGDTAQAIHWARKLFALRPSLDEYQEIHNLLAQVGTWTSVRQELLAELRADQDLSLQTEVYLNEGDLENALAALAQLPYVDPDLLQRAALAAEGTNPRAAIGLYSRQAEETLARRDRANYRLACDNLNRARKLYERLGEPGAWNEYIAKLKQQYGQLRTLRQEMARAGL